MNVVGCKVFGVGRIARKGRSRRERHLREFRHPMTFSPERSRETSCVSPAHPGCRPWRFNVLFCLAYIDRKALFVVEARSKRVSCRVITSTQEPRSGLQLYPLLPSRYGRLTLY